MTIKNFHIGLLSMAVVGALALSGCGNSSISKEREVLDSYYKVNPNGSKEAEIAQRSIRSALVSGRFNTIKSFTFTPKRGGVFVLFGGENEEALVLYGLEDPNNPQEEYTIVSVDPHQESISNRVETLGGGKIRYTIIGHGYTHTVTYDYFHKKVLSSGEGNSNNAKRLILNYLNSHESKAVTIEKFEKIDNLNNGVYLVKYNVAYFDMRFRMELFKIEGTRVKKLLRLEDIKEGPGGIHAHDIHIDRSNHHISYIQTNSFDDQRVLIQYDYLNEKIINNRSSK